MPLDDLVPIIDDRTYADLVAEARTRIPRYTPEWTDLNESDPGIALVELFGWMTELLLFRLGKVPQLNYLKFLELIGFELTPARSATAELSFPVQPTFAEPYVIVPLGTQVTTAQPDAQGPIVFETDRALIALTAQLDAVQVFEEPSYRDVTRASSSRKVGFDAFGPRAARGSALLIGFNSTLDFPEVEIDLAFYTQHKTTPASLQCTAGAAPMLAPATIVWEYWNGKLWLPLSLVEDATLAFTRDGHVRLEAPPAGSMVRTTIGEKVDVARYWIRARLDRTGYQVPPRLLAVTANTASASEAQTIELEVLGASNGRPDQVFTTSGKPILDGTMLLEVDEGEGFVAWTPVPDFFGSGRDDTHYVLNRSTGEVRFGDGRQGRIPVANAGNRQNVRARRYRMGGGLRGNVDAGKLTSLSSSLPGVAADQVTNLFAAGGGADEESLAGAKTRAVGSLRTRDRAVTPEDFEQLAVQSGVARAKALPLRHPEFPGVEVPGVVSVIVVPNVPGAAPTPNAATLRSVCRYLDARRLLTTEVHVVPPRYRVIRVQAELVVDDAADLAAVQKAATLSLTRYFDPLVGGESSSPTAAGPGWPFGGGVYYSLVVRRLLVDGVRRIANLVLQLGDDDPSPACGDLVLDPDMLLQNGDHQINVAYEAGGAA